MHGQIFDLLDKWRHFPAYQLERRADIFFALYLPAIIEYRFRFRPNFIIPEFPVRIGEISEKDRTINKSFKIDYVVGSVPGRVILVELKTDEGSRRDKQDWYLERSKEVGLRALVDGVLQIHAVTTYKRKYHVLMNEMATAGLLKRGGDTYENTASDSGVEILYIQPNETKGKAETVDFHQVAQIVRSNPDPLSQRFAASLESWAEGRAGASAAG